ncbi:MAG TPA: hypothetical protein VGN39_02690 [Terriglobales bacterium]|nr:hypothetical protein [Terriglobales bacterium]
MTVIVPTRSASFELGAAESVNDPGPVPLAPDMIVSQVELEAADQTHPFAVETETL